MYGEGHNNPNISSEEVLPVVIPSLMRLKLYHEAFELAQFVEDDPGSSLPDISFQIDSDDEAASLECNLRLAQVYGEGAQLDAMKAILSKQLPIAQRNSLFLPTLELIPNRFSNAADSLSTRTRNLIQIAVKLMVDDLHDDAFKAFEWAADLHCQLPATGENYQIGDKIHDGLRSICERTGDTLHMLIIEFRRCEMVNSLTGNLEKARSMRDNLLSLPSVMKLPFFQKSHKRQWSEYSILNQREKALCHAERYLEFCRKYKSEDEQSQAEYMRLQSLVKPTRTSEDLEEAELEDARIQLETAIEWDRERHLYLGQYMKQILLVVVLKELSSIQEDDSEAVIHTALKILDDADEIAAKVPFTGETISTKYEASLLRQTLIFEDTRERSIIAQARLDRSQGSASSTPILIEHQPLHPLPRTAFSYSKHLNHLSTVIQNDSQPMLRSFLTAFKPEEERVMEAGHPLERAEFLVFKGFLHYVLTSYADSVSFDLWSEATLESRESSLTICLECFDDALKLDKNLAKETASSADAIDILSARQAFGTRPHTRLIIEIALTVCHELGDPLRIWDWIQKSKARSYGMMLQDTQNPISADIADATSDITLDDVLWVSSASSRKIIFVDWAVYGESSDKLMLLTLSFDHSSEGVDRRMTHFDLGFSIKELIEQKRKLTPARLDDSDASRVLDKLRWLVEPLAEMTKRGDLLVLSPTGPLHNIPLHAIALENEILIKRNPIIYTYSLSVLVNCLRRREGFNSSMIPLKATIIGAYEDDTTDPEVSKEREEIYEGIKTLAETLNASSILGPKLTTKSFHAQAADTELLHFHGHGIYDQHNIMNQSLQLGREDQLLSMSDIAALSLNKTHVTLLACESGIQDYSLAGDEPLGLLSIFLMAGATSALGALWPIQSSTARKYTEVFYGYLLDPNVGEEQGPVANIAMALQHACVSILENEETSTPYHWAPFVLYGAWFCRRFYEAKNYG